MRTFLVATVFVVLSLGTSACVIYDGDYGYRHQGYGYGGEYSHHGYGGDGYNGGYSRQGYGGGYSHHGYSWRND
jgi:hypothetical protein